MACIWRDLKINPRYYLAYNNRGNEKKKLGKYVAALADYDRAIEINLDYEIAYYNRGIVKKKLGDYEGALIDYSKTIEINPANELAYNNRANTRKMNLHEADWNSDFHANIQNMIATIR